MPSPESKYNSPTKSLGRTQGIGDDNFKSRTNSKVNLLAVNQAYSKTGGPNADRRYSHNHKPSGQS